MCLESKSGIMELSITQQIFEQINKSHKILIALPERLNADNISGALGLGRFLERLEKDVEIVSSGRVPVELDFLVGIEKIKNSIPNTKSLVINVDTSIKELEEVSYQTTSKSVNIFLKSKKEHFSPEDITFSNDKPAFDIVFILESASLEDLGALFESGSDVFFEATKINIDNNPSNEYFGSINLVDINATSIAEILVGLFFAYETQLVDEDIATNLLTGLIAKTNSFQHVKTTPNAFLKASELISLGARQQEIIKFLYKTKTLSFLRLWGRTLARLKIDDKIMAAYSLLNLGDFGKAGASDTDLHLVLKELLDNISGYKIVGLLSEAMGGGIKLLVALHPQLDIEKIINIFGQTTHIEPSLIGPYKILEVFFPNTQLAEAETKFLEAVQTTDRK